MTLGLRGDAQVHTTPKTKLGEEGADDDDEKEEEESHIAPPDYERVFYLDHSSMKGMIIHDLREHSPSQTSRRWATKALKGYDRGKAQMMEESESESD
ncbi:hypothetical protein PVK06_047800 [Gossypium arboreum]|uniref:Uncharacterized protein n=1 Tax=Gossypium arboreum TaxID=29729 RepID=A0ABR0MED7_GOSAR|nr:hypothetical protein PVK06_047800 [Gossypium arboreum]